MYDVYHDWGGDFAVNSNGDLALVTGSNVVTQRVCRRLLTNPGDYIWNLNYGGGLAQFVGLPVKSSDIEAVITNQMLLESAVPTTPAPTVSTTIADATNGYIVATITYADPTLQQPISFNVSTG